jgi:hypothetical protein
VTAPTASYWVDIDHTDREAVRHACHALLDLLGPILHDGVIDGYSDFGPSEMNQEALDALEFIKERAKQRRSNRKWFGNPENYAGVTLDMSNDEDRRIVRDFGSWTIHSEIYSNERYPSKGIDILSFHDSGSSITAELTAQEAARLAELLPEGTQINKL